MTRAATGDVVTVKPGPNIYTVLVLAAMIAVGFALGVLIWRANDLGYKLF